MPVEGQEDLEAGEESIRLEVVQISQQRIVIDQVPELWDLEMQEVQVVQEHPNMELEAVEVPVKQEMQELLQ
jgi:hypothetical protein